MPLSRPCSSALATAATALALVLVPTAPAQAYVLPTPVILSPAQGSYVTAATTVVSGTSAEALSIAVILDGSQVGWATPSGPTGAWSMLVGPLADGPHSVYVWGGDVSEVSQDSPLRTFTVDTTPPPAPVTTTPADGTTTSNPTPPYTGTAEPGSTVAVLVDGAPIGTATADASGNWSRTPTIPLLDGSHTVRATASDEAGNTSPTSNTNTFTVDTTPPAAPVVSAPANGSTTDDTTPDYVGTAEPGATVTVRVDGSVIGTAPATGGTWTLPQPGELAPGDHTVSARATDAVGNTSVPSSTSTFTVALPPLPDTTPPAAPVITTPAAGSATTDRTPTIAGTAEPGSTVAVSESAAPVCTALAAPGGSWSCVPATAIALGAHTVEARASDAAGNTSGAAARSFRVVAPAPPVDPDRDDDGLGNADEVRLGTNPDDADTDDDRLGDGQEVEGVRIRDRFEICGRSVRSSLRVTSDPRRADTDRDGIDDGTEVRGYRIAQRITTRRGPRTIDLTRTDPSARDTDRDGLADGVERTGSANARWQRRKTDPTRCDTDQGGFSDGEEVRAGSDPSRIGSGPADVD